MSRFEIFLIRFFVFTLAIAASTDAAAWLVAEPGQANFFTLGIVTLGGALCATFSIIRKSPPLKIKPWPGKKITRPL